MRDLRKLVEICSLQNIGDEGQIKITNPGDNVVVKS